MWLAFFFAPAPKRKWMLSLSIPPKNSFDSKKNMFAVLSTFGFNLVVHANMVISKSKEINTLFQEEIDKEIKSNKRK